MIETYSQAKQDLFVLEKTNYKKNGTFLDIGCSKPIEINNTYLLEKNYNWNGISIDIQDFKKDWQIRKTEFIQQDALTVDYKNILKKISNNNRIDYLSLDLEPPSRTFEMLSILPFNEYRFSVITFEHDFYRYKNSREKSREIFKSHNYILIKQDIGEEINCSYEDWYIDGILL